MGLFGKIFDKKACAICGGEIGLLGNRKLEDGNLCKECASRLSPWFSERRHSTVYEIEQQLAYREANYDRVRAFVPTRVFGEYRALFMDDNMQAFTITVANGLSNGNPDIVDYAQFVSIKPEIHEHRWEDHQAPRMEGQPPIYKYDYDFYITVYVNHPYFDDMRFQLNRSSVSFFNQEECMRYVRMTEDCVEAMSGERPWLSDRIRVPMPVMPHPMPMQSMPMGNHPHAVPNQAAPHQPGMPPRPMGGQPVQPPRPMGGQPTQPPRPMGNQPTQPPRPMGGQPAQPQRPAAPQPGQPQNRPAQPAAQPGRPGAAPSGAGRQAPNGNAPAGPGGRPGPGPQGRR